MKMGIFKYIFSFFIVLFSCSFLFGQDDELYVQPKEKTPLKLIGIKIGVNVGRFADFKFKPERSSYEGSFDFNLSNKYFGVIEAGHSEINMQKEKYNYFSDGNFVKLGLDYNMLKKVPSDYLGVGFRLGWTNFSQSANNILIEDDHWGSYTTSFDSKSYNMFWFEASLGIKGELLRNVYFGWSAIVRMHLTGGKDESLQPYDIPGFGKGSSTIHLGASYYIYYQIPFNRK